MPPRILDTPLVALLTDMGADDWYVGTMKGVVKSICSRTNLVDICHEVRSQNVREGAFILNVSHRYFPSGTIFLCVVDPYVGTDRHCLIARSEHYWFIAPDNGLLSLVKGGASEWETRIIDNPELRLPDASQTFHGRDVFAPAAGHLASGTPFEHFGPPIEQIIEIPSGEGVRTETHGISGSVMYIDRYGNLITSVTRDMLLDGIDPKRFKVTIKGHQIQSVSPNYASVPVNHPLIYWGSSGLLEIGINHGSAAHKWSVRPGEWFELEWE